MSWKKFIDVLLAAIYNIFMILMLASAIASITAQLYIAAVIFVLIALGSAYLAFRRFRGKAIGKNQVNEVTGFGHDAAASAKSEGTKKKKSRVSIITRILIAFIIAVIVIVIGSQIIESRSNIRYMESAAVPLIEALEKYKKANGSYPDTLQLLQPDFIAELPVCSKGSTRVIFYNFDRVSETYQLNCYTGFHTQKRRYDSQSRQWQSWD